MLVTTTATAASQSTFNPPTCARAPDLPARSALVQHLTVLWETGLLLPSDLDRCLKLASGEQAAPAPLVYPAPWQQLLTRCAQVLLCCLMFEAAVCNHRQSFAAVVAFGGWTMK